MKPYITKLLFVLALTLFTAFSVYSADYSTWNPAGVYIDFDTVNVDSAVSTGAKSPYIANMNGSNALCVEHEKDAEIVVKKDISDSPIVFNENKDYVLSFDFYTTVVSGFREIMHYDGDINYQKSRYVLRIGDENGSLYMKDLWGVNIAELNVNTLYNIKCYIDGDSRRIYKILVNNEEKEIDLYHFHYELPETIDNFNIVQKNWGSTGVTYYDNLCLMEQDKLTTNVFFNIGSKKEVNAFSDNSSIDVCAVLDSPKPQNAIMYLAVYDEALESIKAVNVNLNEGMNYIRSEITIDSHSKLLKVFVWADIVPIIQSYSLGGNTPVLEYKSRVKASILESANIPDSTVIASYINHLNPDGSFDNIRYTSLTTDFCYTHCSRLTGMALALSNPDYNFGDLDKSVVTDALEKGIVYWLSFDTAEFNFDNWYYNRITVPNYMGKVLLFFKDTGIVNNELENALKTYMSEMVKGIDKNSKRDTGSNILQMQRNKIYYALYLEDTDMVLDAFSRINKELRLADTMTELGDLWRARKWETSVTISGLPNTNTGIQSDYAYLFHGPQILSGSYGLTFLNGISEILVHTNGLDLFPEDGVKNITDLLLEHYAYIGRGNTLDYSTIGRAISDKGEGVGITKFAKVYDAAEDLLEFGSLYRRDELLAFADSRPAKDGSCTPTVTGHKYFSSADYTAHAKADYLFTLKTSSARTIASESLSYSNLKGRHLGDGVTFIYRTGSEYNDIFAAYNWHRLPGTTSEEKDFDIISSGTHSYESTKSQRVGGISFNGNGATAMELIRDSLNAKKSWFMFDDAVVCLGTDITIETDNNLYTSVNQCLSVGDAFYALSDGTVNKLEFGNNQTVLDSPKWVLHDKVGYIFNSKANIYAENQLKQGDRYDISWDGSPVKHKTDIVRRNVFSLWFNHKSDSSKSYEYIIVPNVSKEQLNEYSNNNTFNIISNSSSVQAASFENEVQAVFWHGSSVEFCDYTINTTDSCIISAVFENGKVTLDAKCLDPNVKSVTVTVYGTDGQIYSKDYTF